MTPTTETTPRAARPCRQLRWKGMYIDAEPDTAVPNTSDGLCWCVHTQTCLGPDGKVADRESCTAGRSCYQGR